MINCKYDLLTSEYSSNSYIVYKPDSLSNTTALQVRSTKFDLKPDVKTTNKVMHTTLSFAKNNQYFDIRAAYDTMNIPQSINGSTFKISTDVVYDASISPEENVNKVIKMYSDEVKEWLFNFVTVNPSDSFQFNVDYVRNGEGGCLYGRIDFRPRYTASNAYIIKDVFRPAGCFTLFLPRYNYSAYDITSNDTVSLSWFSRDTDYSTPFTLVGAMVSPKMQFPDPSRCTPVNLGMQQPIAFSINGDVLNMHVADYTSTSYTTNNFIATNRLLLNTANINSTLLWLPGAMFWNVGGIHIAYSNSSSPAKFSIAFCKYSEEASTLTNIATTAYGASEITVNISAVLPNLELDADHLAALIPMYHYMINDDNYFVVALFHNVKTVSAADPSSFKGLYILCMETGDMYNASTGFNHVKFNLDASFDVSNLLYMYAWQQYDDAAELGSNAFQYTITTTGSYTVYTFNSKRIEICPYKAYGNYYLVCNPELYDKWYIHDIDLHKIHMMTNVPVSRNHCITPDGMHGFRFESNNKTDYIVNNNYYYPTIADYDENVVNSIGIVRVVPLVLYYTDALTGYIPFCETAWNGYEAFQFAYNPTQTFEPIDINKSTAVFRINSSSPHDLRIMYFVVDITTDDRSLEFHHKRMQPVHTSFANIQSVDMPYTLTYNTTPSPTPYNNIKVYINEFLNNDMFVCNANDLLDVKLKQSTITSTNQSFRIMLYDDDNNIITQEQLKHKYGVAAIDLDFLF